MANKVPLQRDLFTGDLVDTRTRKQKKAARRAGGWQQGEMFSQRELAQWGVRMRPMRLRARNGQPLKLVLQIEDPRTEKEKEADRQREAEALTYPMVADEAAPVTDV